MCGSAPVDLLERMERIARATLLPDAQPADPRGQGAMSADRRYARQRLLSWWDQDRLRDAQILVAGAGALGNEVLKNLALLGVGRLVVVDFDVIERSNLSRCVLFRDSDIGRPKAEAAAESIRQLNGEVDARSIGGDLFFDVGLGQYRHSALAIGCLDSQAARARVSGDCGLAGIPYLDGGMWALGGEARWFPASGGPCFECTLRDSDRNAELVRYTCDGFSGATSDQPEEALPTLACTAAVVGGMLAQEAVKWLCQLPTPMGRAIVYNGQGLTLHRSRLEVNAACPSSHTPYEGVIELESRSAELTARDLLARASKDCGSDDCVLHLGRDLLVSLKCPLCKRERTVNRALRRVREEERLCPDEGARCETTVINAVESDSPYAERTLSGLGVPPADVVAVQSGEELLLYELTGDLPG
jgi:molybdopterin/thiamine biosynthesis adenylyltransferase